MLYIYDEKIKKLSNNDKKNISQLGLKIGVEFGKLANVLLPFDNADGTTHRFVDRDNIAEEIADLLLCIATLAHKTSISSDKLEHWIKRKTLRWEKMQEIASFASYPYEIHVTVKDAPSYEQFKEDCASIGVKPVVLDLHTKSNDIIKDVMTSSTIIGDNRNVIDEVDRITSELESKGYEVIRQKIETVPWHPNTKTERNEDNYYESHIPVTFNKKRLEDLYFLCKRHPDAHLSRNSLKELDNEMAIYMVTVRNKDLEFEKFQERVNKLLSELEANNFETGSKNIIEWAIYDNNIDHDNEWVE